jgi:uncharacterized protein
MSEGLPEDAMDIPMLDGFLTALIIGPTTIMPSQWLPKVWGDSEDEPMTWESADQAERMIGLVMRHMNDIIWRFKEDPENYEPVVFEREHEGKTIQ